MSIEGQGHFFTIYFPGFVCFVLYLAKISGERLQDHWSSGFICENKDADQRLCFRYRPVATSFKVVRRKTERVRGEGEHERG